MAVQHVSESRRYVRKVLSKPLVAIDTVSHDQVGLLINLSIAGFMLNTDRYVDPGSEHEWFVDLPFPLESQVRIRLKVVCRWCQPANFTTKYGAGFEILDLSKDDARIMDMLFELL